MEDGLTILEVYRSVEAPESPVVKREVWEEVSVEPGKKASSLTSRTDEDGDDEIYAKLPETKRKLSIKNAAPKQPPIFPPTSISLQSLRKPEPAVSPRPRLPAKKRHLRRPHLEKTLTKKMDKVNAMATLAYQTQR